MAVFAVDGDEVLGADQFEHMTVILAAAVPADVDVAQFVVEHIDTLAEEVIDRAVEELFVARDGHGAEDDGIALTQGDLAMLADAHAHHGAGRFALAAGGDDDDLLRRQRFHLAGGE